MITNYLDEIIKSKLEITLNIEYLYLDSIERNKFARSAHEYLIEQVQQIEFSKISQNNNTIQLDIFHCCKDMFWFIQKFHLQLIYLAVIVMFLIIYIQQNHYQI